MEQSEKYIYWEEAAKYDLETAKAMLAAGRYLYVVFMCQQAIEKLVKGLHVLYTGNEAKRTHNIWIIFDAIFSIEEYSSLVTDELFDQKVAEYKLFFADLLYYYISERYPSYKQKVSEKVGETKAKEVLNKTEEAFFMAAIPEPIQEIIEDYINKIRKQIPVEKAFLFGSYAQGTYTPDSDIDLAIFSSHFENMEEIEGFRFLILQAMDYNVDLQPQPFTLQDFREPLGIVEEIIKNGIEI